MADRHDPDHIKKRIEALAVTAQLNSQNIGGDNATAAADLMCAFVLISMRSGADPDKAIGAMRDHAVATCAYFFGRQGRNHDA